MHTEAGLGYMFRFQTQRLGGHLVAYSIFFTIIALSVIAGFSFLMPPSSARNEVLYLATGAPMTVLVMTTLVVIPIQGATARVARYIDFIKSLPVSRKNFPFANCTVWLLITMPATIISIIIVHSMFHPGFSILWIIIPIYVLVATAYFDIGHDYSYVTPAELTVGLSRIIAFVAPMLMPISFPMGRLPEWLQVIHPVLSPHHMAQVMRAFLAHETFQIGVVNYAVLAVWSVLGFFAAIRILEHD